MKIFHPTEIRSLREKIGLTQAQLAKEAEVTQAYIAKIETGKVDPKLSTLEKISEALKNATSEKQLTAKQVMEQPIISAEPSDNIEKAIKLMESNDISQIPILEDNKQVGSLSEETILHEISTGEKLFKLVGEEVQKIMEDPFPTIGTKTDLDTVFHLLEHNPAVLVLKKGNPTGIITKADILQLSTR